MNQVLNKLKYSKVFWALHLYKPKPKNLYNEVIIIPTIEFPSTFIECSYNNSKNINQKHHVPSATHFKSYFLIATLCIPDFALKYGIWYMVASFLLILTLLILTRWHWTNPVTFVNLRVLFYKMKLRVFSSFE